MLGGGGLYIGKGAGPKNFSVKDEISRVSKRAQQREKILAVPLCFRKHTTKKEVWDIPEN